MIYCKNCDMFFEKDEMHRSTTYVPYGLGDVKESTSIECPHCYSTDLEFDVTPVECEGCGRIIPDSEAFRDGDSYYCERCYDYDSEE